MLYTKLALKEAMPSAMYTAWEQFDSGVMDAYHAVQIAEQKKDGSLTVCYKCGGKTLVTAHIGENRFVVQIIFGKDERAAFDQCRAQFSDAVQEKYDASTTYHDGKWMFFDTPDSTLIPEYIRLLAVKKKPNKKRTMCGYCCSMCKAYAKNIKKQDEREVLAAYWKRYYGLEFSADEICCDGCRCKPSGIRIDSECPVRACVVSKGIDGCAECGSYPCDISAQRAGLSYEQAYEIAPLTVDEYYAYLGAYDNRSWLRREKGE